MRWLSYLLSALVLTILVPFAARATASELDGALAAREAGRLDEATQRFERALTERPDDPHLHTELGITLAWQGEFDAALVQLERAIVLAEESGEPDAGKAPARMRARVLAWSGALGEAEDAARALLADDPDDLEARVILGGIQRAGWALCDAVESYEAVLVASPGHTEAEQGLAAIEGLDRHRLTLEGGRQFGAREGWLGTVSYRGIVDEVWSLVARGSVRAPRTGDPAIGVSTTRIYTGSAGVVVRPSARWTVAAEAGVQWVDTSNPVVVPTVQLALARVEEAFALDVGARVGVPAAGADARADVLGWVGVAVPVGMGVRVGARALGAGSSDAASPVAAIGLASLDWESDAVGVGIRGGGGQRWWSDRMEVIGVAGASARVVLGDALGLQVGYDVEVSALGTDHNLVSGLSVSF